MSTPAPDPLALLGDLASAGAEAHGLLAQTLALVRALGEHVPVVGFELARRARPGDALRAAVWSEGKGVRARAESAWLDAAGASELREPFVLEGRPLDGGKGEIIVLPLRAGGALAGVAVIELAARGRLSPGLLPPLAKVLAAALRADDLVGRVAAVSRSAHRENRALRSRLELMTEPPEPVAESSGMKRALEAASRVAPFDTTVLLRGESGTGKEVLASYLQRRSSRASGPYLRVNCGALPAQLLESELFGHERGAFTSAVERHRGYFERAHGGTLLLDEVAELTLTAQVTLLRVLQEGELSRVGGEEPLAVDVRLLAATNRPLEAMVASGAFREDLYYRLNVFPITLPPLRERAADLRELTSRLLSRIAARLGKPAPALGEGALEALRRHAFPGNVRELENLLERACILSPGGPLVLPPLPPPVSGPREPGAVAVTLDAAVKQCIEAALRACQGRVYGPRGAAARLGLEPSTLQSKMKRLSIARPRQPPGEGEPG